MKNESTPERVEKKILDNGKIVKIVEMEKLLLKNTENGTIIDATERKNKFSFHTKSESVSIVDGNLTENNIGNLLKKPDGIQRKDLSEDSSIADEFEANEIPLHEKLEGKEKQIGVFSAKKFIIHSKEVHSKSPNKRIRASLNLDQPNKKAVKKSLFNLKPSETNDGLIVIPHHYPNGSFVTPTKGLINEETEVTETNSTKKEKQVNSDVSKRLPLQIEANIHKFRFTIQPTPKEANRMSIIDELNQIAESADDAQKLSAFLVPSVVKPQEVHSSNSSSTNNHEPENAGESLRSK